MNTLIEIANKGRKIISTNYWQTEHAKAGKLFFSINAGCIRMLIPETMEHIVPEIKTGKKVILSRGPWPDQGKDDAFEFLFEDFSESPYCLQVGTEQWDMLPKEQKGWIFAALTETKKVYEKRLLYRTVDKLPCMEPWGAFPFTARAFNIKNGRIDYGR